MTSVQWSEWRTPALGAVVDQATLVVPVGATEQHGPHLPVGVDTMMADHVARAAATEATTVERPLLVAPALPYGSSHHHLPRPGTLSVASDTFLAALRDVLASAAATGFRRVVVINGHGGNEDLVRQAIRDVTVSQPVVAAAAGYWSVAWDELRSVAQAHGIGPVPGHAGAFETSLVLALRPDLVDTSVELPDHGLPVTRRHPLAGPVTERHGWVGELDGYTDAASCASADAGQRLIACVVHALAHFLMEFAATPLPAVRERGGAHG